MRHRANRWLRSFAALACAVIGCQSLPIFTGMAERTDKEPPATLATGKHTFRVSQFVFESDVELNKNQPLFKELETLREQVYRDLQLPPSSSLVTVHLFENRDKYEVYMQSKFSNLPKRRAFFVAQPKRLGGADDLDVYTYWGDRVQQDLRHELTHALLHCVLKDVPLWLDEGLAECFEMPSTWSGVNYQHLESLRTNARFDLDRLEKLTEVRDMSPAEYREAWAWTHLMLRTTPQARQVLLSYLQELRTNPRPAPLKPRLNSAFASLEDALKRHLADLDLSRPRAAN